MILSIPNVFFIFAIVWAVFGIVSNTMIWIALPQEPNNMWKTARTFCVIASATCWIAGLVFSVRLEVV